MGIALSGVLWYNSLAYFLHGPQQSGEESMADSSASGSPNLLDGQNALVEKIFALLPQLSEKHQDIARFVLDNPDTVAFGSASMVGAKTGTSAATVVRFCQALGYAGYVQLQEVVRERMSQQRAAMRRLEQIMADRTADTDLLTRVLAMDIHSIERTAILANRDRIEAAVEQIRYARQVLIIGSGLAAMLVEYLLYSLQRLDVASRSVTGGEEPLAMALAFVQPEDVVVAISFRRRPRHTVKALEQARSVGAKSIGIADSELSPLLPVADYRFVVAADNVDDSPSPVAAVSLLNALIAILSLSAPERTAHSLERLDATYKQSGLLDE
jgi:DNA-binding MurR/RpiR family transcriptional regulator